jgi:hypothetical protein
MAESSFSQHLDASRAPSMWVSRFAEKALGLQRGNRYFHPDLSQQGGAL